MPKPTPYGHYVDPELPPDLTVEYLLRNGPGYAQVTRDGKERMRSSDSIANQFEGEAGSIVVLATYPVNAPAVSPEYMFLVNLEASGVVGTYQRTTGRIDVTPSEAKLHGQTKGLRFCVSDASGKIVAVEIPVWKDADAANKVVARVMVHSTVEPVQADLLALLLFHRTVQPYSPPTLWLP